MNKSKSPAFPNMPNKTTMKAVVEPHIFYSYLQKIGSLTNEQAPETIIFLYNNRYIECLAKTHNIIPYTGYFGKHNLHQFPNSNGKLGVLGRVGIGAPVMAMYMEELIAWGCKKFLHIGYAGSIHPDANIGDIIVCEKSLRDEGVSHHYIPTTKFAMPDKTMTQALCNILTNKGISHTLKPNWTIDAVYRETIDEVMEYQSQGIATVEMETAALFSIAEYRNVKCAAIFVVSDNLSTGIWDPHFHSPLVAEKMDLLINLSPLLVI